MVDQTWIRILFCSSRFGAIGFTIFGRVSDARDRLLRGMLVVCPNSAMKASSPLNRRSTMWTDRSSAFDLEHTASVKCARHASLMQTC